MLERVTLNQAERCIRQLIQPTPSVHLPLIDAVGRVLSTSQYARENSPPFAKSAFDGYAVTRKAAEGLGGDLLYRIDGEIAAGDSAVSRIRKGTAYRIMTGAPVPHGTWKVVPQESCSVVDNELRCSANAVLQGPSRIQRKGIFIRKGTLLADKGTSLQPAHLGLFAEAGINEIDVHRRPRVGFFSSGSELTATPDRRERRETISSNRFLLAGLIGASGCRFVDYGIIADNLRALYQMFERVRDDGVDILISTGGTGPGKYDLLKEALLRHGGRIVFSSLRLRPGKSAFLGTVGTTIHFGLPGPPAAVQPLFQVLILPALRAMQGLRQWRVPRLKARLAERIDLGRSGPMLLYEAVLACVNGDCLIRSRRKKEAANCYLCCPPGRRRLSEGMVLPVVPISGCRFSPVP